jgi:molecular chaperone GrpE
MSRKKKKKIIEVATEEEVAQYAGEGKIAEAPTDSSEAEEVQGSPEAEAQAPRTEAEDWKDKFLRAKAELANFQRRSANDRHAALKYANAELVKSLLPVLDDLQRVVENGASVSSSESVVDGVKLTIDNFLKALDQHHTTRIEAEGQPFDPALHEAMLEQPSPEHTERTVLQVVADGYKLHDRVLRPAKVIVSKPVGPESDRGGEEPQGEE